MVRVGLISDTHGLLRPEALDFLRGSKHIVHAGDIGQASILAALAQLAPVTAVRGNNDTGDWAAALHEAAQLRIGEVRIHVVHDRAHFGLELRPGGPNVVVCGHSHQPLVETCGDVLYVNPGSAGPRRFRLPVAAAELRIDGTSVSARIIDLLDGSLKKR